MFIRQPLSTELLKEKHLVLKRSILSNEMMFYLSVGNKQLAQKLGFGTGNSICPLKGEIPLNMGEYDIFFHLKFIKEIFKYKTLVRGNMICGDPNFILRCGGHVTIPVPYSSL